MEDTIEKEILETYKAGKHSTLGTDGGALKYIACFTSGGRAHASITLDREIAEIRKIWELSIDPDGKGFKKIYDYTNIYYKLRKI